MFKNNIAYIGLFISLILLFGCGREKVKIELVEKEEARKVDVLIDGSLFTSYIYQETIKKPVLWPVVSPGDVLGPLGVSGHPAWAYRQR